MDTVDYATNSLVADSISSIAFRLYEPAPQYASTFPSVALTIEGHLRQSGHLALYDTNKRAIWHFRIIRKEAVTKDENKDDAKESGGEGSEGKPAANDATGPTLGQTIEHAAHMLVCSDEGTFDPISLQRNRSANQTTSNPPSATQTEQSQRGTVLSPSQSTPSNSQEQDSKVAPADTSESKKEVYEAFIATVVQAVSSDFCKRTGALPLDYRTVLLSPNPSRLEDGDIGPRPDSTLGTFRSYLTTTGSLVISLKVSHCNGLSSVGNDIPGSMINLGQPLVAAPFGVLSPQQYTAPRGESGTVSLAQTPSTYDVTFRSGPDFRDSVWKQVCAKVLQQRGVTVNLRDCSWVNVHVAKRRLQDAKRQITNPSLASISWPRPLCFRKKPTVLSVASRLDGITLSGHEESHDPLGNARGWFTSSADREEKVKKRKEERAAAVPRELSAMDPRVTSKANGQSPLALRRPSTAAAGAMYPTPPDALQNPNGVTPSFDGNVSTPGNPPTGAAVVDVDANIPSLGRVEDGLDDGYELNESKRERSGSNLLGDGEEMFEDMGGDMFGDNDITEADFSFFDEEPSEAPEDLPMTEVDAAEPDNTAKEVSKVEKEQKVASAAPTPTPAPASQVPADDAVFAKPELKHASSYINGQANSRSRDRPPPVPAKRGTSPFSPDTVFKRVRATMQAADSHFAYTAADNKTNVKTFDKVNFDPTLPLINKKYERGGIFDFKPVPLGDPTRLAPGMLPETEYLKKHGKHIKFQKRYPVTNSALKKLPEADTATATPFNFDISLSDDDASSIESDQDDSSYMSEDPPSPAKTAATKAYTADDDAMSQVTSLREVEQVEEPDQNLALELPRLSRPEQPETSLVRLFSDPEPLALDLPLSNEDMVQVAQILAEQAALGTLNIFDSSRDDAASMLSLRDKQSLSVIAENALHIVQDVVQSMFSSTNAVRLKGLLDVQDVPIIGQPVRQPGRIQPRPIPGRDPNAEQKRPNNLYQIPGPHLEMKRSEAKLSVLPSAVQFWESLGLAPSSGSKDVHAVAVFPGWKGMGDNASSFLDRMKSVYESLKLGVFEKLELPSDLEAGVLPYEVDRISTSPDATVTGHGSALVECMETLNTAFANLAAVDVNVVAYFVYSPSNPSTIVEACTAFQRFFESYQKHLSTTREEPMNELVLQLVSADSISSPTSVVVTPPQQLVKLCMETYDRCTLFGGPMPAPAIRLEQSMPRLIDFKLSTTPSASLIHENSCIHVAYAPSVDERWVAAAWTDDRGNQQATAAYCLGRRGKPSSTSMHDVAHEIWESTLELISVWKVHWRVIITKCGPMEQQEIDFWLDLARTEIKANVTMILMTVDTSPSLQLIPPAVKLPHSATLPPLSTTPVSTPQANIVSPEQSGTPHTPIRDVNPTAATPNAESPGETDSDAVLVDITDQTWGAILGHRLSNSSSILEVQPALASGYLIKRTGVEVENAPAVMEVNLVHTEAQPRAHETLFREMLSYFRGLGTLARARGVTEREADVRPWHVAAAEKAVRALYLLM